MPDPTPQTPTVETPPQTNQDLQPASEPTPQQANREALYAKYYGQEPQQPVEPTPQPVVQQPTPPDPTAELTSTIAGLKAELEALKTSLATPTPQTPPVQAPPQVVSDTPWVDKLKEGDFKGAEAVLSQRIQAQAVQQAAAQALEAIKVHNEIDSFLKDLRSSNTDIVPMERYIMPFVTQRVEAAKVGGKIQSADDYVKVVKECVNAEVEEARKLIGGYRASAKNEALTSKREVLSASTLQPQQIQTPQPTGDGQPQVETTSDYLAARMARAAAMRGL